ncbi:hypothetical protein BJX62DRAFT_67537 [Aspergillus germanicus]
MSWCETLILVFRRTKEFRAPSNKILAEIDTVGCLGQNEGKWRTEVALLLTALGIFLLIVRGDLQGFRIATVEGLAGNEKNVSELVNQHFQLRKSGVYSPMQERRERKEAQNRQAAKEEMIDCI